jgi:hypothetical protein
LFLLAIMPWDQEHGPTIVEVPLEAGSSGVFTVPKGVCKLWIQAVGGGGAGGDNAGGGGGGGAFVRAKMRVFPRQEINFTVGAGGQFGVASGLGGPTSVSALIVTKKKLLAVGVLANGGTAGNPGPNGSGGEGGDVEVVDEVGALSIKKAISGESGDPGSALEGGRSGRSFLSKRSAKAGCPPGRGFYPGGGAGGSNLGCNTFQPAPGAAGQLILSYRQCSCRASKPPRIQLNPVLPTGSNSLTIVFTAQGAGGQSISAIVFDEHNNPQKPIAITAQLPTQIINYTSYFAFTGSPVTVTITVAGGQTVTQVYSGS